MFRACDILSLAKPSKACKPSESATLYRSCEIFEPANFCRACGILEPVTFQTVPVTTCDSDSDHMGQRHNGNL